MQEIKQGKSLFTSGYLSFDKIKSTESVEQINKLHKALNSLEKKCNQQIANKYLTGFLETKGVNTYRDFINSLT